MSLAPISRESQKGLPNNTFDRTAGSHSLGAAGQRRRSCWGSRRFSHVANKSPG